MYIKAYRWYENDEGTVIEMVDYTEITNLTFSPSADLVGVSIPINEFQVDIHTEDNIDIGAYVELYDDNDVLWASYWAIYAEHIDEQTLRLRGQSEVAVIDRVTLPAVYYDNVPVKTVLDDTIVSNTGAIGIVNTIAYTLDDAFVGETITGFCPEQTARERLLWVCFCIGAYVKAFFNTHLEILPIDSAETMIPMGDTYWKPTITFNDWVTGIKVKAYSFTMGEPQTTDTYVKDFYGRVYIVTETELTLMNPDAPAAAPENIMAFDGVYLVNEGNVSQILTHLAQWYFKRTEVDLDIIDNGTCIPGDKVLVYADDERMFSGFINSASFTFGLQTKASIHLTAVEGRATGNLTILYFWDTTQLDKKVYLFPVGYFYSITNPYIDQTMNGHKYIFRPINEKAEGTVAEGDNTNTQYCAVALDLTLSNMVLHVISVDSVTEDTDTDEDEGTITIGVIS